MLRTQPTPSALAEPWFAACNEGRLLIQRCSDCGNTQFYPRSVCSHCGSGAVEWMQASGRARVASFTVVRRPVSAAYEAPYVVALVDLEEGPRLMSNIVDVDPAQVSIGQPVLLRFEDWGSDQRLPVFAPVDVAAHRLENAKEERSS